MWQSSIKEILTAVTVFLLFLIKMLQQTNIVVVVLCDLVLCVWDAGLGEAYLVHRQKTETFSVVNHADVAYILTVLLSQPFLLLSAMLSYQTVNWKGDVREYYM